MRNGDKIYSTHDTPNYVTESPHGSSPFVSSSLSWLATIIIITNFQPTLTVNAKFKHTLWTVSGNLVVHHEYPRYRLFSIRNSCPMYDHKHQPADFYFPFKIIPETNSNPEESPQAKVVKARFSILLHILKGKLRSVLVGIL